ncbi:MAG TPA: HAD-IIA family hydrolase [Candidatus Methanofastidiosa archaeon]|nr:HAD-IIA family hydrolase [Candidatus Methanofastidiosa archaeon]
MDPGYLIDIDGVIRIGDRPVPGAIAFLTNLQERSIPFLLVTNNSTRTQQEISSDISRMGVDISSSSIVTSSMVAADFIAKTRRGRDVMVIGEEGLRETLSLRGMRIVDERPDHVVVGLDWSFTYDKMRRATLAIRSGAQFIATNTDRTFPMPEGLVPGAGALVASIEAASGTAPIVMGKPFFPIFTRSLSLLGIDNRHVFMIGDRYDTDMAGAANAKIGSILVTTGVNGRNDAPIDAPAPDLIVDSLLEIDPEAPL